MLKAEVIAEQLVMWQDFFGHTLTTMPKTSSQKNLADEKLHSHRPLTNNNKHF